MSLLQLSCPTLRHHFRAGRRPLQQAHDGVAQFLSTGVTGQNIAELVRVVRPVPSSGAVCKIKLTAATVILKCFRKLRPVEGPRRSAGIEYRETDGLVWLIGYPPNVGVVVGLSGGPSNRALESFWVKSRLLHLPHMNRKTPLIHAAMVKGAPAPTTAAGR